MFIRILYIIIPVLLLAGCSSQKEITADGTKESRIESSEEKKKKAMEHFINGSVAEAKGDYALAVIEYQDALKLDPSHSIYFSLGKNYLYLNRLSNSLQNLRKAVDLSPDNIEYLETLSDVYSGARMIDSSAIILEKIIKLDSVNVSAHFRLARLYETSRPLTSLNLYKKLLELVGPDFNVFVRIAELQERMGNIEETAKTVESMVELDPGNNELQILLIEYYQRLKLYDKAISFIDETLTYNPDDLMLREKKAQTLILMDKWNEAAEELSALLNHPEVNFDSKVRIGATFFEKSFQDSSMLSYSKEIFTSLDKDTTDWQVKMYLGAIATNEQNYDSAIEYFGEVTELARWNVEAWIRLGGLYFDNKKYDEAITVLFEAVENFPDDYAINLILGISLTEKERFAEAEKYLAKAVSLQPNDIISITSYAFTLNKNGNSDEAIRYLNHGLKIDKDNVHILGTLGMIYDSLKEWEKCDSTYTRALELEPDEATINNNFAYSLAERGIRLDEALEMSKLANELSPDNSAFLDTLGWIYFKLGDYKLAKIYIESAVKIDKDRPVLLEHLGDVHYKLGEIDEAHHYWNRAYEINQDNDDLRLKIEKGAI